MVTAFPLGPCPHRDPVPTGPCLHWDPVSTGTLSPGTLCFLGPCPHWDPVPTGTLSPLGPWELCVGMCTMCNRDQARGRALSLGPFT